MKRLTLILGIVSLLANSGSAALFSEDFEGYGSGSSIAGTGGWGEVGEGQWFQASATVPADPDFLNNRYADLSNNAQGTSATNSWLFHGFAKQTSGVVAMAFDVLFEVGGTGGLDSCNIYLSDGDRTTAENNYDQIAAAVSVGTAGLRIHNGGGWRAVDNITINNDTWYRFYIEASLDLKTWGLQVAEYSGETLGAATAASYSGGTAFGFRDDAIDDIGLMEFMAKSAIMNDPGAEGFLVDNINAIPEPATAAVLCLGALAAAIRRRRKA